MKVICPRDILLENINIVSRASSTRTTTPILECILLEADDDGFKMTATDLNMGIKTSAINETEILEHGLIALESKMFSEIIRKMPDGDILIHVEAHNVTTIRCNKAEYKIVGQPGEEFPKLQLIEQSNCFSMPQYVLKSMIKQTIFAIATEETRPVLTGELFEIKDGVLKIVALDGFRIAVTHYEIESGEDNSAIVSGKTMSELNKILSSNEDDTISIYFTDKNVMFDLGGSILISQLIAGEYYKYQNLMPDDYDTLVRIDTNQFLMSVERAALITPNNKKIPVRLTISEAALTIDSRTELGAVHDEIATDIDGPPLEIGFNPKYLIDILRAVDSEKVAIQLTTPLSACIIKPIADSPAKFLILPVRL